ncbi:MAG: hypothetical protein IT245_08315 [Bacteroidia bacterium]|nr:hypothetical protein [Bacteroidia bacterium]
MKKILNYSGVLFMALTLTLGACKKTEDPAPSNTTAKTGTVKCKVDGQAWESNTASQLVNFGDSMIPGVSAGLEGDTFSLMAFRSRSTDTSLILLNAVLSPSRLGTYTLNTEEYSMFYFNSIDPLALFATLFGYTSSSTLTITKYDASSKKMSGTFTCTMTPSGGGTDIKLTEGEFTDLVFEVIQ